MKKIIKWPFSFLARFLHRRYKVRYKFNKKHLVADLFLLFSMVFLIVLDFYIAFIFTKWVTSLGVKVNVEISQPVISGGNTKVTIIYSNADREGILDEAVLGLRLPENFKIKKVSDGNFDLKSNTLKIGRLLPLQKGRLELEGEAWGNFGEEQKIFADLKYIIKPTRTSEDISWRDEKLGEIKYNVSGSVVDCSLESPSLVVNGNDFNVNINCRNNYSEDLGGLKIKLIADGGLKFLESSSVLNNGVWELGSLKPQEGKSLSVKFSAHYAKQEKKSAIAFELYGFRNNKQIFLDKKENRAEIFYPQFKISGQVNGADNYSPVLGEELEYKISYKNLESEKISSVQIVLDLNDPLYLIDTIKTDAKFSFQGRQMVLEEVDSLEPKAGGEISFKIKISDHVSDYSQSPYYLKLVPWVNYSIKRDGQSLDIRAQLPAISNPLTSSLSLAAFGRYYTAEGEQIGVGPLPPIVGMTTKYRIFWQVNNLFNKTEGVKVVGVLPGNVSWTGEESISYGQSLIFNPKTRELIWYLDEINPFVGFISLSAGANFSLEVIPTIDQVGKIIPLLKNIQISGKDKLTGRELQQSVGDIFSSISGDKKAALKGGKVLSF